MLLLLRENRLDILHTIHTQISHALLSGVTGTLCGHFTLAISEIVMIRLNARAIFWSGQLSDNIGAAFG